MQKSSSKFTQAVIGAQGNMGQFLTRTLSPLSPVLKIDVNSSKKEWGKALKADVIWLSIPRNAVADVLEGKTFSKKQLIIDICTIKKGIGETLRKFSAAHLSFHSLHGSKVPLIGQRWAIIKTPSRGDQHPLGKQIIDFLKKQGVAFLPPVEESQHDFMMGITLSIPEVLTMVMDEIIKIYAESCGMKVPTKEELMRWAVPASNSLFGAYTHIVNSTPEWLRYEIIKEAPQSILGSVQEACRAIESFSLDDIRRTIAAQAVSVDSIPNAERDRVRRWINQWFVDSTKTLFKAAKESRVKPALKIQWMEDKKEIFPPSKKRTVAIHGIDGCFTHEALLRFLEENDIPESKADLKFLVTAENVLEAVTSGATDLGIFAIANSGSGTYVSSMGPIAEHTFKVQAVLGMEIMQCLLVHPSIKDINAIKEVFGHPQAISQCTRTLEESYPNLAVRPGKDTDDTALCAQRIAEGDMPKTTATLASQIAGKRYGLTVIAYNMHHDPFNTTTFLLVSKK